MKNISLRWEKGSVVHGVFCIHCVVQMLTVPNILRGDDCRNYYDGPFPVVEGNTLSVSTVMYKMFSNFF